MQITIVHVWNRCSVPQLKGNMIAVFPVQGGWAAVCNNAATYNALAGHGQEVDGLDRGLTFDGHATRTAILAKLAETGHEFTERNTPPWEN